MPDLYFDVDTALSEVPVNIFPLTDSTDFATREESVAYNAAGMDLQWNFVTSAGAFTQTVVTPTTAGVYDWTNQGNGMYTIEIPASGGGSINNNTEGYGWFTGVCTGVLPWRGPTIGFRAAAINDSLCDTNTTGLLAPTVAARTLDVSAGGEAGMDWANVGTPSSTVSLTNTTVANVTTAATATNVTTVNGLAANVITATSINTGAITSAKFAAGAINAAAIANSAIDAATFAADVDAEILSYLVDDATRIDASALNTATVTSVPAILADTGTDGVVVASGSKTGYSLTATTGLGNQTANITGNLSGSVGSVTGAVGSVTGNVGGNVSGSVDSVTSGVTVTTNNDKTGYTLSTTPAVKKNTALSTFSFFMRDSADHVSGKTGLTVTAERSIDGAAFGACANSVSELSAGVYLINLANTDVNGNVITLKFTATGADPTIITVVTDR